MVRIGASALVMVAAATMFACGGQIEESTSAEVDSSAGDGGPEDAGRRDADGGVTFSEDSATPGMTPMAACAVAKGNVLALQGAPTTPVTVSVTYATMNTVQVAGENTRGQWSISVSTEKQGLSLKPGLYNDAQQFGTEGEGRSGFAFTAQGIPSSCDGSSFRIDAINVAGSALEAFVIDFEYQCNANEPVRGCFHYDPSAN